MRSFLLLSFFILWGCTSQQIIQEPTLDLITIKSESFCPTWNWHPFCVESKPNSILFRGVLNNTTGEKKYYIDYHLDTFDTDIPVGISIRIDGTFYILKKVLTDYSDSLKIRSEIPEDVAKLILSTDQPMLLSYSNRKKSLNFEMSSRETRAIQSHFQSVRNSLNSIQRMKIAK